MHLPTNVVILGSKLTVGIFIFLRQHRTGGARLRQQWQRWCGGACSSTHPRITPVNLSLLCSIKKRDVILIFVTVLTTYNSIPPSPSFLPPFLTRFLPPSLPTTNLVNLANLLSKLNKCNSISVPYITRSN